LGEGGEIGLEEFFGQALSAGGAYFGFEVGLRRHRFNCLSDVEHRGLDWRWGKEN
jgi:hypothetical protein